ncbi:adenine-specific methyltransferase EcoRI family protein [soil metagenome]
MAGGDKINLTAAKSARADEFYTQLPDIERELKHYRKHFTGKTVFLNCDDPRVSNFFHYFSYNFEQLGLKKLIAACYKSQDIDLFSTGDSEQAIWLEYNGDKNGSGVPELGEIGVNYFRGDGDFRSAESVELLKQADIVVTNPPFSLFREYVAQLIEHEKKFLVIGPWNAITYKEIFPLIESNKLWLGHGFQAGNAYFATPHPTDYAKGVFNAETGLVKFRNVNWFTNLDLSKRHEELVLFKSYDPTEYPSYDNYDGIEVAKTVDIPSNFDGVMGVPITFLDRYNPDQFEIVGIAKAPLGKPSKVYPRQIQIDKDGKRSAVTKLNDGPAIKIEVPPKGKTYYEVDGEYFIQMYARILIRRREAKG